MSNTQFTLAGNDERSEWPPPPTYEIYVVTGDLAEKVRVKLQEDSDAAVEIQIKKSVVGYSEWTWWHDFEFTLLVSGLEVMGPDSVNDDDEGNMLKFLIDWLDND